MTNKEQASLALERALDQVNAMTPGLDRRVIGACLEEARDRVAQIQELKKPRKPKFVGPMDDPETMR